MLACIQKVKSVQAVRGGAVHPGQAYTTKAPSSKGPTIVKARSTERPKLHGRKKKSIGQDPPLQSKPLTEDSFDNMVPVRERRVVLGAVALPMTVAATTMGLFNQAQIETLRAELFQNLNKN
jgi:hypothetical protein